MSRAAKVFEDGRQIHRPFFAFGANEFDACVLQFPPFGSG